MNGASAVTSSEHGVWQVAPSETAACAPCGSEFKSRMPLSDLGPGGAGGALPNSQSTLYEYPAHPARSAAHAVKAAIGAAFILPSGPEARVSVRRDPDPPRGRAPATP